VKAPKTHEEIQSLIDGKIEESLNLDYKGAKSIDDHKEIAKDVSAFANSTGGVIIYGIREENHLPVSIEWINARGIRELLENVVLSTIQPRLSVTITPIQCPTDTSKAIFAVEIPEGDLPHMAVPFYRYFKRFNFQSVPMEEYEVRDRMFRRRRPSLSTQFKLEQIILEWKKDGSSEPISLGLYVDNNSPVMAKYVSATILIPSRLKKDEISTILPPIDNPLYRDHAYQYYDPREVFYPGIPKRLGVFSIRFPSGCNYVLIGHWVVAEDMESRFGSTLLLRVDDSLFLWNVFPVARQRCLSPSAGMLSDGDFKEVRAVLEILETKPLPESLLRYFP
jgi:hypothetical protein